MEVAYSLTPAGTSEPTRQAADMRRRCRPQRRSHRQRRLPLPAVSGQAVITTTSPLSVVPPPPFITQYSSASIRQRRLQHRSRRPTPSSASHYHAVPPRILSLAADPSHRLTHLLPLESLHTLLRRHTRCRLWLSRLCSGYSTVLLFLYGHLAADVATPDSRPPVLFLPHDRPLRWCPCFVCPSCCRSYACAAHLARCCRATAPIREKRSL